MKLPLDQKFPELSAPRLRLRRWRPRDLEPFALLNADPRVMEFLPRPLARPESDALVERIERDFDRHGFGLWALESRVDGRFLGFTGLDLPSFEAAFTPCVEVGWRLAPHAWGRGYATEAARAALEYAFRDKGLAEVVSFTVPANRRSRAVMERLGMRRDPREDFDHPGLPPGHPLGPHVLYRLRAVESPCLPSPPEGRLAP